MAGHAVTRTFRFCYGHRIAGHAGPCAHLHGHNARVEVECRGPLDPLGMVIDFGEIRSRLEGWIRDHWDHRMLLRRGDPLVATLRAQGEPVYETEGEPTAENLAAEIYRVARSAGLPVSAVRFWETDHSLAVYEGP